MNLVQTTAVKSVFTELFNKLFGTDFSKSFLYARKYEKLTVLKQFVPHYKYDSETEMGLMFNGYLEEHKKKYGNNLIIVGNRVPAEGYSIIDKRYFDEWGLEFTDEGIIEQLFTSSYINLGFIDPPEGLRDRVENIR